MTRFFGAGRVATVSFDSVGWWSDFGAGLEGMFLQTTLAIFMRSFDTVLSLPDG